MRYWEEQYKTPPGAVDYPYIYIFDCTGLTDGNTYQFLTQAMPGDSDFILRRIVGFRTVLGSPVTGKFLYRNASQSQCMSAPVLPNSATRQVLPEKFYPRNAQILFDLYGVTRAFTACAGSPNIYTSQLGFQGLRRYQTGSGIPTGVTPYPYREAKWQLGLTFTLSTFAGSDPVSFVQPINNYDVEVQRISITYSNGNPVTTEDFLIQLYDPNQHQFFSQACLMGFINNAQSQWRIRRSVFPVPTVVYPVGSAIRFDITSLLCGLGGNQSYQIVFDGIQRLPTGARPVI